MYTEDLLQAQLEARQAGRDFAVATIAEALGSTPRTNGKMIVYADGTTLKDVGIPAGGTVLVRFDIDSAFISQWKSYNAMPTQAMVSAAFRNDED